MSIRLDIRRPVDIARLARVHRWAHIGLWTVGITSGLFAVSFFSAHAGSVVGVWMGAVLGPVVAATLSPIAAGAVLWQMGSSRRVIASLVTLMLVPGVNAVLWLAINETAERWLQQAGLVVGRFGARREDIAKLNKGVCYKCGYDLTGLSAERCPECGTSRLPALDGTGSFTGG